MLLKAFERIDDLKLQDAFPFQQSNFRLMTADAHDLPFDDDSYDTIVGTFFLESTYNIQEVLDEIKRVCRQDGKILIISRGANKISLYNSWLKFVAARDLTLYGMVEHIDFDAVIERQKWIEVEHKERKNMGMTYIYILRNNKDKGKEDASKIEKEI